MKLITRESIPERRGVKFEDVPVPEWGEDCGARVSELTAGARLQLADAAFTRTGEDGAPTVEDVRTEMRAKYRALGRCLLDGEGDALFESDAHAEAFLESQTDAVVNRLWGVVRRLSGLDERALEEAEKNSEADRTGD